MNDLETPPPPSEASSPDPGELLMRRRAAAVLEVLGGAKTPIEAAQALGVALPSYYILESRAVDGLVAACEPRPRGRAAGEGRSLSSLKRDNERLRQDLTRVQALTRAFQQAAGGPPQEGPPPAEGKSRRRRRSTARALRAARKLAASPEDTRPSLSASPLAVESPP